MNIVLSMRGTIVDNIIRAHTALICVVDQSGLGHEVDQIMDNIVGNISDRSLEGHLIAIREKYPNLDIENARKTWEKIGVERPVIAIDGAVQALEDLRDIVGEDDSIIAISDGGTPKELEKTLDKIGALGVFDSWYTASEVGCDPIPDPTFLQYVVEDMDLDPAETILIGSTPRHSEAAKTARIRYIEVETGWRGCPASDYEAERVSDLPAAVDLIKAELGSGDEADD